MPPRAGLPRRAPTPADLLLVATLLGFVLVLSFRSPSARPDAVLWVHGVDGTLQLDAAVDGDVAIQGPAGETLLRLRDGRVWIAQAPCKGHVCQRMGPIEAGWGSLVCIPNQVVVRFAVPAPAVDGVTR